MQAETLLATGAAIATLVNAMATATAPPIFKILIEFLLGKPENDFHLPLRQPRARDREEPKRRSATNF
jgi:hypothetical protein